MEKFIGALLLLAFVFFLTALCVQVGYNASVPFIFPGLVGLEGIPGYLAKTITFTQACAVVCLMAGIRGGMGVGRVDTKK